MPGQLLYQFLLASFNITLHKIFVYYTSQEFVTQVLTCIKLYICNVLEEKFNSNSHIISQISNFLTDTFCAATRTLSRKRNHSKMKTGRLASGI